MANDEQLMEILDRLITEHGSWAVMRAMVACLERRQCLEGIDQESGE